MSVMVLDRDVVTTGH